MRYSRTTTERRGIIGIGVPLGVARALESGRVLVNGTFGKNGAEVWVQFMDPDFAHKTYTLEDAEELISSGAPLGEVEGPIIGGRVTTAGDDDPSDDESFVGRVKTNAGRNKFKKIVVPKDDQPSMTRSSSPSPSGVGVAVNDEGDLVSKIDNLSLGEPVRIPTASVENQVDAVTASAFEQSLPYARPMSYEAARELVVKHNLARNRKNGCLNDFPSQSLVREDFKKTLIAHFQARVVCVANTIGSAKMLSRIASTPGLKIPGCENLSDWWLRADKEQRFLAVTSAKHIGNAAVEKRRLLLVPCPFQDAGLN